MCHEQDGEALAGCGLATTAGACQEYELGVASHDVVDDVAKLTLLYGLCHKDELGGTPLVDGLVELLYALYAEYLALCVHGWKNKRVTC